MPRRALRYMVALAALLAGLAPTARAQEAPPIGWGVPRDGLQVGLFAVAPKRAYTYGDTLTIEMRVRNVSQQAVDLTLRTGGLPFLGLAASHRLRLDPGTGQGTARLQLAPGQVKVAPYGTFQMRIVPITAEAPVAPEPAAAIRPSEMPLAAALLPGRYTLDAPMPLWIADKDDPNRATGHRAKSGSLAFTVTGPAEAALVAEKNGGLEAGLVMWGEVVDGLQSGITHAMVVVPDRADRPVELEIRVRNRLSRPGEIIYPELMPADWSPMVTDSQGKGYVVRQAFISGMRGNLRKTLQPGEEAVIGRTSLQWRKEGDIDLTRITNPTLVAPEGKYFISISAVVRFPTTSTNFNVVLVSGKLPISLP